MNYWITTHWPPRVGEAETVGAGVWLAEGREHAGRDLQSCDLVLIYQSRSGRTLVSNRADGTEYRVSCATGKGGIVAVGRATEPVHVLADVEEETYADGTRIRWLWHAHVDILSTSGFLDRSALNQLLGYKGTYNFRGFGDANSGLKRIDADLYYRIAEAFTHANALVVPTLLRLPRRGGPGGEGEPHRLLKEYVAICPCEAFQERGISLIGMERSFVTGDRADIVLSDHAGRIMGVEVEVHVGDTDVVGFLQAIKYARMLEPMYDRSLGDSRAVLVAYSIAERVKALCSKYGVECIELPEERVRHWHAARAADQGLFPAATESSGASSA